jgi:hypothetical protein
MKLRKIFKKNQKEQIEMWYKHEGEEQKLTKIVSWIQLTEVWSIGGITFATFVFMACPWFCFPHR